MSELLMLFSQTLGETAILAWLGQQVLYAAIVAGLVAVLIAVCRIENPLARQGLWSLVLLRLVLPVDLASPFSLREAGEAIIAASFQAEPQTVQVATREHDSAFAHEILWNSDAVISTPSVAEVDPVTVSAPIVNNEATVDWGHILSRLVLISWLFGMAFFALRYGREWLRYFLLVQASPDVHDPHVLAKVADWRAAMGVGRTVRLKAGTSTLSPFTMGVLRPVIYVPRTLLAPGRASALDAALGHEMAHVRRLDDFWIKVEAMVKILYFFFPLVWWAGNRIEAAREEACDALALTRGKRSPKAYADGLLTTLRLAISTPANAPCPGLSQDKAGLKTRLLRLKSADYSRWSGLRALGLIALVGGCTLPLANAADAPPAPEAVEDAFVAAEAPTPPAPPRPAPLAPSDFDTRFEQAMQDHEDAIASINPTYDAEADMHARIKEREKARLTRGQERMEREVERQMRQAERQVERLSRAAEREARHEMRRARHEVRAAIATSQHEALEEAMEAMAEVEGALAEIDWSALSELNEGLMENGEATVDIAAILRDAGVFELRERIMTAIEDAHRQALEDVEQSLKSVEQRAQQNKPE